MVLPFANLGGDPEQEYFADGVTESLTNDLARISGSFVIGRNTAFSYKGKHVDLKQIGRELNVHYILEGSVLASVRSQRAIDDRTLIETHVVRVEVYTDHRTIKLAQAESEDDDTRLETVLSMPWQKMASARRCEILIPEGTSPQRVRQIRSVNRATLVASIARSRRWLNELISDPAEPGKHCRARAVQHPKREPDTLARLPRPRSRQGRD
jgi:hypothetical protein